MRKYTVYYTKTTFGQVEIVAENSDEAEKKFDRDEYDVGTVCENTESAEVHQVL